MQAKLAFLDHALTLSTAQRGYSLDLTSSLDFGDDSVELFWEATHNAVRIYHIWVEANFEIRNKWQQ
jgi:hypothetical protein